MIAWLRAAAARLQAGDVEQRLALDGMPRAPASHASARLNSDISAVGPRSWRRQARAHRSGTGQRGDDDQAHADNSRKNQYSPCGVLKLKIGHAMAP
jgi:hypothetical protein